MPEVKFWKLMGSGTGEGFTPVPNTAVYAILTVFDDPRTARTCVETSALFKRYTSHAANHWTLFLHPTSVRGEWAHQVPFDAMRADNYTGPLAALTRATIKPRILGKFWSRVPAISAMIGSDPNVIFKIGVGEVPWFHQVTFSIWPDAEKMAEFARRDGPHAQAIRAVREHGWFKEELYARFVIADEVGAWPDVETIKMGTIKQEVPA